MTENFLVSQLHDQRQTVIERWVERLYDHSESLYEKNSLPKLDSICEQVLDACQVLMEGRKNPLLIDFFRDLIKKHNEWDLKNSDILGFSWEFRKDVLNLADQGGDPGSPNGETLMFQLETCVEASVIPLGSGTRRIKLKTPAL